MEDKIIQDFVNKQALEILKNGLEELKQDKVLEPYYTMYQNKKTLKKTLTKNNKSDIIKE
jgi:hypothetical protein